MPDAEIATTSFCSTTIFAACTTSKELPTGIVMFLTIFAVVAPYVNVTVAFTVELDVFAINNPITVH